MRDGLSDQGLVRILGVQRARGFSTFILGIRLSQVNARTGSLGTTAYQTFQHSQLLR
jgi:hypothetical protein